ncbi:acyltransferase [Tenacibaculum aiptasiae]|uniref:acyltransferase n=1 Tax=Tenacibaculum aiptasiae TaxID=426481 RepID=UPI003B5A9E44
MDYFCHKLSDVQSKNIGRNTKIWQYSIILKEAEIGENCNINAHVFIENDVVIGNNVTVKSGVQLWDGITLEDNVFIGPNVTFTNDLIPRSKSYPEEFLKTIIKKGVSIGANSTIIGGVKIHDFALIGAGSVVTKNVGKNELWVGSPAKQVGFITRSGEILNMDMISKKSGVQYEWGENDIIKKL